MLRSTLDPEERGLGVGELTAYMTGAHRHRLLCGKCGEICCVDKNTFRRASRAIMEGFDNPFLCPDCAEEPDIWLFAE
jgi:hypothetical protein